MYACAVGNVSCFGGFAFTFGSSFIVGMAAVAAQFAAFIGVYYVIYGLYGYRNLFFCQLTTDLFGRPLVVNDHLFYAPYKHAVKFLVRRGTLPAFQSFSMSLFPQIVAFISGVTLELPAKC